MLFKVYGERNSGTEFIVKLLRANHLLVLDHVLFQKDVLYWKHGVPDPSVKNITTRVVDIFIFRELHGWLRSMYKNPYELIKYNTSFQNFLMIQQMSNNYWIDAKTRKSINIDDNGKTIFEIRYHKYNSIVNYKNTNKDVVFVNLSYIQNPANCEVFLRALNEKYELNITKFVCSIDTHTKANIPDKNRVYDINEMGCTDIIESRKNREIEEFIDHLTFQIY